MIRIQGLEKSYRDGIETIPVLRGLSLSVEEGAFVALAGPSGSGKSTLLHVLGGLDRAYQGEVKVRGEDLSRLSEAALARYRNAEVGFVFQSFNLLPPLTVLQNLLLPTHFSRKEEAGAKEQALLALERVGLAGKAHRLPSRLSGGERQRVALARAVFRRPRLILADEPTGSLDGEASRGVIELLLELNRQDGITVIVASHEPSVWEAAGRLLRLREGRLLEEETFRREAAPAGALLEGRT